MRNSKSLFVITLCFLMTLTAQAQRSGTANFPADVKGMNVSYVAFSQGSFDQVTDKKWDEFDVNGKKKFSFEETHRDEWSVYLVDKSRNNMRLQLDLWTKKINVDGKLYTHITKVREAYGMNVTYVAYNQGSFRQIADKKWGEFRLNGKQAFTFDELGRDMWSVYLIDKSRGGMRIQLDLHTKKVNIDGTPYYNITKTRKAYGMNVQLVVYALTNNGNKTGSFKQTGDKKWTEYGTNKDTNRFEETHRDEWSVYLIDKTRNNMRIQLDLHTKKVNIDGTHYYNIVDASLSR